MQILQEIFRIWNWYDSLLTNEVLVQKLKVFMEILLLNIRMFYILISV